MCQVCNTVDILDIYSKQPSVGLTKDWFISFPGIGSPRQVTHSPSVWDILLPPGRQQIERTDCFLVSPPKQANKVGKQNCPSFETIVTRLGLELATLDSLPSSDQQQHISSNPIMVYISRWGLYMHASFPPGRSLYTPPTHLPIPDVRLLFVDRLLKVSHLDVQQHSLHLEYGHFVHALRGVELKVSIGIEPMNELQGWN